MNEAGDAAQIVHVTLEGVEFFFKIGTLPFRALPKIIHWIRTECDFSRWKGCISTVQLQKYCVQRGGEPKVIDIGDEDYQKVLSLLKKNKLMYVDLQDLDEKDGRHQFAVSSTQLEIVTALLKRFQNIKYGSLEKDYYGKNPDQLEQAAKKRWQEMQDAGVETSLCAEDFIEDTKNQVDELEQSEELTPVKQDKMAMGEYMLQANTLATRQGYLTKADIRKIAGSDKEDMLELHLIAAGLLAKDPVIKDGRFVHYSLVSGEEGKERLAHYGAIFPRPNKPLLIEKSEKITIGKQIKAATLLASQKGFLTKEDLLTIAPAGIAEQVEQYMVTAGILSKELDTVDGGLTHRCLLTPKESEDVLAAYDTYQKQSHFAEQSAKLNQVPITLNIKNDHTDPKHTNSFPLFEKEYEEEILFRVPGTFSRETGADYIRLDKKDLVVVDEGKSMLSHLDLSKEYTVYNKEGQPKGMRMGKTLYEESFDPVKRRVQEIQKQKQTNILKKRQSQKGHSPTPMKESGQNRQKRKSL